MTEVIDLLVYKHLTSDPTLNDNIPRGRQSPYSRMGFIRAPKNRRLKTPPKLLPLKCAQMTHYPSKRLTG